MDRYGLFTTPCPFCDCMNELDLSLEPKEVCGECGETLRDDREIIQ